MEAMRPNVLRLPLVVIACLGLSIVGCAGGSAPRDTDTDTAYLEEIAEWHESRLENLRKPDGWLTLIGLHWLSEGANAFGSDSSNAVLLPRDKAPADMGEISLENGVIRVTVAQGAEVFHDGSRVTAMALRHDQESEGPTVLTHGTLSWYVVKRGERFAVRVKDSESPARRDFKGIECFPVDPRWRIEGVLEPHEPPRTIEITNVFGAVTHEPSPGSIVFDVDGASYRLDPIAEPGDDELFVVFGDATSGKETYGGGRFLGVARPGEDRKVIIDFNKAYNPPCVFTPFATCPLPPQQNRLPVAVRAGERAYEKPGH